MGSLFPIDQALIIDPWAGLSYRALLNPTKQGGIASLAPTWVGKPNGPNARRLNAYKVLEALYRNSARLFLNDVDRRDVYREYGDAALLVEVILAAVLGDEQTIQVDGAGEQRPDPPADLGPDATPEEQAANEQAAQDYAKRVREWEAAVARQEWFDAWATNQRFPLSLHETERNACRLGDGVYELAWSNERGASIVDVHDPGFYFPVLDTQRGSDYPTRVHLAWQETIGDRDYVHRITYELRSLWVLADEFTGELPADVKWKTEPAAETGGEPYRRPVRNYAYAPDVDSELVCVKSEARWPLADLRGQFLDAFTDENAEWLADETTGMPLRYFDMGCDFIPVVHVPNTVALIEHFGTATLTTVSQLLDDLASLDTDTIANAGIVASPPIGVEGIQGSNLPAKYGPGQVFWGGKVTIADTSSSMDALLKTREDMRKLLSTNSRIPEEVLGRVKAGDISSGVQLLLSFGPFRSLVGEMRLAREDKYRLLFKFVQRFAILAGAYGIDPSPGGALAADDTVLDVELEFGSYMPNDLAGTANTVQSLVKDHLLSRATAVRWLQAAGAPIDDVEEELRRIESEDFEGALALANAVADELVARDYLHLPPAEPTAPTPPAPQLDANGNPIAPAPAPAPGAPPTGGADKLLGQ